MIQNIKTRWADIHEDDDDINEMHELWGAQEDDYDPEQNIMQVMMDDSHELHDDHESQEDHTIDLAFDDVTGKPLKPELVHKARQGEIEELERLEVFDKVPLDECWKNTGKPPITARWLDINKGDDNDENYRSRYVAKEIKKKYCETKRKTCLLQLPHSKH